MTLHTKILILLLTMGTALRIAYILWHPPEDKKYITSDMKSYHRNIVDFASGKKLTSYHTYFPQGTAYFYSPLFKIKDAGLRNFFVKVLNVTISMLTCILMYFISIRLFKDKRRALIALGGGCLSVPFIFYIGYYLSETGFLFFIALSTFSMIMSLLSEKIVHKRLYAVLFGMTVIIAATFKSSILLFLPFFGVWWIFKAKRYQALFNLPFYAIGFVPILLAISMHNTEINGKLTLLSTNSGINFYYGKSHVKTIEFKNSKGKTTSKTMPSPSVVYRFDKTATFSADSMRRDSSGKLYKAGIKLIKQDPAQALNFALLHVRYLVAMGPLFPTKELHKSYKRIITRFNWAMSYGFFVPAIALGLILFGFINRGPEVLLFWALISIIVVVMLFFGDSRFRVPYDFFAIILASHLYVELWDRAKRMIRARQEADVVR